MVVSRNRVIGVYSEFADALEALAEIGGGEVYRVVLVARLSEEEARALKEVLLPATSEPVEAPVRKESGRAIVLDQGLSIEIAENIAVKLQGVQVYLASREISEEERRDSVILVPSSEVTDVVEDLVSRGFRVVFVTSNKKLYTHYTASSRVKALYLPRVEQVDVDKLVEEVSKLLG